MAEGGNETGVVRIEEPGDERLALFTHLTDPALRRSRLGPGGSGVFIAESVEVARQVLTDPALTVVAVAVTPRGLHRLRPYLAAVAGTAVAPGPLGSPAHQPGPGAPLHGYAAGSPAPAASSPTPTGDYPVYVADDAVLQAVTGYRVHRGVLVAVARPAARPLGEVLAGAGPLVAVVEGVNDQENLGALFRNAAALGVGGLVICPRCCDPLYRRTVRVSMGAVLRLPWARATAWPDALHEVRAAGFVLEALAPHAERDLRPRGPPERVAVLVGSEGDGLSAEARAAADRTVKIPMHRGTDSLNVATAAAIAFAAHAPAYDP